jgi:hypothetical protein
MKRMVYFVPLHCPLIVSFKLWLYIYEAYEYDGLPVAMLVLPPEFSYWKILIH